ncbi:hypothetical protein [Pantoea sp. GD03673]|uniref:hypothetical protein n=1 Tax=Pantoea sp. GD03673 TaxID=2975364 RepID=UPI00244A4FD5|nr:hypothetical protein [Pantoea sp. GD03673]MDH2066988.1 hypothetical protein [Pantoea sp. GD03673]
MIKKNRNASRMKNVFSLLLIEGGFLLLCIPLGIMCGRLDVSEGSLYSLIVAYVFLTMAIVPVIHKRFILKQKIESGT